MSSSIARISTFASIGDPSLCPAPGAGHCLARYCCRLRRPADLARHVLLCSLHRPDDWPTWLAEAGVAEIDGNDGLKFENSALAYQAAIDEVGIVVAQRAFVEDDLRAGRLVEVFDLRASTGSAYYLAYPAQERVSAKIRAFEDWIVGEAARLEEAVVVG